MSNAIHAQILGKFVLLLLCSIGVKILVIYWHISDWNKEKIGISKFKNIHIGATLPERAEESLIQNIRAKAKDNRNW